jgi:hypothetical protein
MPLKREEDVSWLLEDYSSIKKTRETAKGNRDYEKISNIVISERKERMNSSVTKAGNFGGLIRCIGLFSTNLTLIFYNMRIRLRRSFAQAAMLIYLMTVSPVYAMSEIEHRAMRRSAIVQTVSVRQRHRALDRRYGYYAFSYQPQF